MNTLSLITLYFAVITSILFLLYCLAHYNWIKIQSVIDQGVTEESTIVVNHAFLADKLRRRMFWNLDLAVTLLVISWLVSIANSFFKFI